VALDSLNSGTPLVNSKTTRSYPLCVPTLTSTICARSVDALPVTGKAQLKGPMPDGGLAVGAPLGVVVDADGVAARLAGWDAPPTVAVGRADVPRHAAARTMRSVVAVMVPARRAVAD
jgi:hypothetical protein